MKSMVRLTVAMLTEISDKTGISTDRDIRTIHDRVRSEGSSFLTITLPSFEGELLSLLHEGGRISSTSFPGFRKRGGVPEFLGGLLGTLFSETGDFNVPIVPEDWGYQASIIRMIRSVLLLHKKVELDCTPERTESAIRGYIETDKEISEISEENILRFRRMSRKILGSYLGEVERQIYGSGFHPKHSSGSLATRERYNERFRFNVWTERLQHIFPYWEDVHVSWREQLESIPTILSPTEETPSRVISVPKTMKGPRVIAMEPVWNQYSQQGILHCMTDVLESWESYDSHLFPLWEAVNWTYQDYNQLLAKIGSKSGKLATIDLSEASDRVSAQLVRDGLLGDHSYLSQAIFACRSERADVNGEIISLKKFASMGSALTFPMESLVFYTLIHLAWERTFGSCTLPLSPVDGVRVYGDDMVVPTSLVPALLSELETYGLKVNHKKSFWTGFFRESCGSDWYAGFAVNTVKVRHRLPTRGDHAEGIRSAIELHNNLLAEGWSEVSGLIAKTLRSLRFIPYGPSDVPGLHLHTDDQSLWRTRFNRDLWRLEFYSLIGRERKPTDPLDGYGAMRKFFRSRFEDRDPEHLLRDGRSQCVGLHTGWVA